MGELRVEGRGGGGQGRAGEWRVERGRGGEGRSGEWSGELRGGGRAGEGG